mmetsp:Transcript_20518/g.29370  ORF Transcript_20518/g.29370 Transcript_20518/m.29370 type:complete len:140 (-) Transcript_20518:156-575(-)|eukprot:CAMPEP_0201686340 /NCGR_PEP_ID=MMETSP0578-20130828/825_1 /ASSEMBLY_ACC=CAM_ASM_000663 /TAXON_ID=267565 /ORGANISM="Skeletonema grethea, Strain CCMP 1804" /LENGTH=139 /DNA_ID=CAMNT_0048170387 /DNA_START=86 /DNA_END=505 /DNA_ORIENTATION=+
MVAKLLKFDDIAYPDELIVKFQGKDKLRALRNKISVPIDHIESITVFEPANIQDDHGLVKVTGVGVGAGSLGRRSKVGTRKSMMERSSGKEKTVVQGKAITLTLRKERNKELDFEVNDVESEKVIRVLLEMFEEASFNL